MDRKSAARSHYLDKRVDQTADLVSQSDSTSLLSTEQLAHLLGYSKQWLEIGRHKGYGPPFRRLGTRRIRYMVGDVLDWLEDRKHRSTSEYMKSGSNGTRKGCATR